MVVAMMMMTTTTTTNGRVIHPSRISATHPSCCPTQLSSCGRDHPREHLLMLKKKKKMLLLRQQRHRRGDNQ